MKQISFVSETKSFVYETKSLVSETKSFVSRTNIRFVLNYSQHIPGFSRKVQLHFLLRSFHHWTTSKLCVKCWPLAAKGPEDTRSKKADVEANGSVRQQLAHKLHSQLLLVPDVVLLHLQCFSIALQDCAHCQVGGGFEYCSGSNANNATYDYSDYGESILGQGRPQNRVGRRSCAADKESALEVQPISKM